MLRRFFGTSNPTSVAELPSVDMAAEYAPTTPEELVKPADDQELFSMEEIAKALKRKRATGSKTGGSRASSAETALEQRLAKECETVPPPPRHDPGDEDDDSTPCANQGQPNPGNVPVKAAPKVPANLKDLSAIRQTKPKPAAKKQPTQPDEELEPSGPHTKRKKVSDNARIYACPLCPQKYESAQQRYIHCGMDHLVYIPMIEGAAQSATNGNELHLVQMVRKFNHPETGVPTYDWRGHLEHKAFWSVLRNAKGQNQELCQGYVWKRMHKDDHIPTLITDVPVEQRAEFHGETDIRVLRDDRILPTRLPSRVNAKNSSTSWHSWRNPSQKGWFGSGRGSGRKPVSPKAKSRPASGEARGSNEQAPKEQAPQAPQEPQHVIPVPDDEEPPAERETDANKRISAEIDAAEQAVNPRLGIEPAVVAPLEVPVPVPPPQLEDPAQRPTTAVTLQQSFNMINESWQCLAQHTYGAQYAGAVLEARVLSLEQASPKLMTDIIKRITFVYEQLNENDTTLSGQLNILKEDTNIFLSQLDQVKAAAENVKQKTITRMAAYEVTQQFQTEQIDTLKKQVKSLEEVIRLMYDATDKQSPGASSAATPAQSK